MKSWIKILVWTYLVLLLAEGALRKWVAPSLSDPLLIVRDPVVIAIYVLALASGIFPTSRFIAAIGILAVLSVAGSLLGGHTNLVVLAYGLRINYLHLPLIWIMGRVLDRRDVERMGAFLLIMAIPMTLIMVQQFRAPMNAFINRGVGNDEVGQIFGADGRIRPPGLFSFITGPQLFFPLCAAFFFDEIGGAKRLPWYLLITSGLAIALALPVSISRTVMLGTAGVALVYLCALPFASARFSSLARPLLLLALVGVGLSQLPVFREGSSVFKLRWDTAATDEGGTGNAWNTVMERTVSGFSNPYYFMREAPMLGHGIGTGSNVGARLTSGSVGFTLAEEEWGKVLLELGPVLGLAFILFRLILSVWLGWLAWRDLRRNRNPLPILIFAATGLSVLQGQWGPPTVLGFAVIGSGMVLAALNPHPDRAGARPTRDPLVRASPDLHATAPLPAPSDRRPPVVLRPVQK